MRKGLLLFSTLLVLLSFAMPAQAQQPLRVFYAGPEQGGVRQALDLDPEVTFTTQLADADVVVLNNDPGDIEAVRAQVGQGAGLVVVLGDKISAAQLSALFVSPLTLAATDEALSLVTPETDTPHPLTERVAWSSAPQVHKRFTLQGSGFTPLVSGFDNNEAVLLAGELGAGRFFLFTAQLDGENLQFQEWPYFNYLFYYLTHDAAGQQPLSFARYSGSPVPHASERVVMFALLGGILIIALSAFLLVRRYSRAHPHALDTLVANPEEFSQREAGTDWEQIGFHRPLGGFFLALYMGLLLFVPLIIYQNLVLPVYVLPSAQAIGIWGRVTQFFAVVWNLFDMGTSEAFIKFMSQYRVKDPRKAIQFGQVYVWWQVLSGAVQVALMVVIAGAFAPETAYALYAWSVIIHTLIQIPGIFQVMRHALTGLQRFDYAQILDISLALVFPILVQPIIVTLLVAWGRGHPQFGTAMGGLIGLGLAAYAAEALTFLLGLFLYRRLGYNARLLFMAHFDWKTVKESFKFGVFNMLGSLAWAIGQAVEIFITQIRLVNYAEVWGNWVLAQNFIFGFSVLSTLYSNLMPSISEAISHARVKLSQYYAALAYKWGGVISAFIAAVLLAVADRFILGASGPQFVRAAEFAIPLILWGAIQYPSWVGDNVQRACNKPYLMTLLVAGEQTIRIGLAFALMARLQINALIIAYFIGLLTKDLVGYFVNHKVCFPQRFYFWQSLAAPLLAGAAHYAILRWATGLIWANDQITSVLIFFIGILLSYPLFAFLYGLFGGWDDGTLGEVRRAVELSNFMRPLAWLFWKATALGAQISPLHGRFPIDIRAAALEEARTLTEERVSLVGPASG